MSPALTKQNSLDDLAPLAAVSDISSLMTVYLYNNNLASLAALDNCAAMDEVYVLNNPAFAAVPNVGYHFDAWSDAQTIPEWAIM